MPSKILFDGKTQRDSSNIWVAKLLPFAAINELKIIILELNHLTVLAYYTKIILLFTSVSVARGGYLTLQLHDLVNKLTGSQLAC